MTPTTQPTVTCLKCGHEWSPEGVEALWQLGTQVAQEQARRLCTDPAVFPRRCPACKTHNRLKPKRESKEATS